MIDWVSESNFREEIPASTYLPNALFLSGTIAHVDGVALPDCYALETESYLSDANSALKKV